MDWLLLVIGGLIGVGQIVNWRNSRKVIRQLEINKAQLVSLRAAIRVRQGTVKMNQANHTPPDIVRPRTVTRDTPDIPATGRMRDTTKRSSSE